jgi:hypothetical protein
LEQFRLGQKYCIVIIRKFLYRPLILASERTVRNLFRQMNFIEPFIFVAQIYLQSEQLNCLEFVSMSTSDCPSPLTILKINKNEIS